MVSLSGSVRIVCWNQRSDNEWDNHQWRHLWRALSTSNDWVLPTMVEIFNSIISGKSTSRSFTLIHSLLHSPSCVCVFDSKSMIYQQFIQRNAMKSQSESEEMVTKLFGNLDLVEFITRLSTNQMENDLQVPHWILVLKRIILGVNSSWLTSSWLPMKWNRDWFGSNFQQSSDKLIDFRKIIWSWYNRQKRLWKKRVRPLRHFRNSLCLIRWVVS